MNTYDEDEFVDSMTKEEADHVKAMPSMSIDDAWAELAKRAEAPITRKRWKGAKGE